ncbi:MAG TPA: hypothetical protein PKH07_11165 [bacterium]|nr:hypothetical protein [bacterium]
MRNLVIWGGPVSRSDLKVDVPLDTEVVVFNQGVGGIGSNAFRDLALSYLDADDHILPGLLRSKGIQEEDFDRIVLAGFSAFHGMANEILKHDADRVIGLISLDACFSSKEALSKKGYEEFSRKAIRGEAVVVMTASLGGGQTFSTGEECVLATAEAAMSAENVDPVALQVEGIPEPEKAFKAGDLYVLDYAGKYSHQQHVWVLAQPILNAFLLPILEGKLPSSNALQPMGTSKSNGAWGIFLGIAAALATVGSIKLLSSGKE